MGEKAGQEYSVEVWTAGIDTAAFKPHQLANAGALAQPRACVRGATLILVMSLSVASLPVCLRCRCTALALQEQYSQSLCR